MSIPRQKSYWHESRRRKPKQRRNKVPTTARRDLCCRGPKEPNPMGYQPDSYYRYSYKNILTRAFVVYTIVQSKPDLTYGTTVIHHRFVSSLHWLPYWLATTAFQDNSCESFEKAMSYYSIWDLDSTSEKLLARKATAEAQATRT